MSLRVKKWGLLKKVVMDGRSAMAAEIREYDVFPVDYLRRNISTFEKEAVTKSDFRIAVSEKLIDYWREKYKYTGNDHVVIPCTLDRKYFNRTEFEQSFDRDKILKELGFSTTDIIFVYAGSNAPWQSFKTLENNLGPILGSLPNSKVLFLSKESEEISDLCEKFKGRVVVKWLDHEKVLSYLHCCDYGILIREQSDTNKVASPVKFAEYLYAGLNVIISKDLGDLSEFVQKHQCGYLIDEGVLHLAKIKPEERERSFKLALAYFKKESPVNERNYKRLINFLNH